MSRRQRKKLPTLKSNETETIDNAIFKENILQSLDSAEGFQSFKVKFRQLMRTSEESINNFQAQQEAQLIKPNVEKSRVDKLQDAKLAVSVGVPIVKGVVEDIAIFNAIKERSVTKQATVKRNIEAINLGSDFGQAAYINPKLLGLQIIALGYGEYQNQKRINFEVQQNNRESEIRARSLGTILSKGGR